MTQGHGTELLIRTADKGCYAYNYRLKLLIYFAVHDQLIGVVVDANGYYWAFSRYVLYRFDRQKQLLDTYRVSPQLFASYIPYLGTDVQELTGRNFR